MTTEQRLAALEAEVADLRRQVLLREALLDAVEDRAYQKGRESILGTRAASPAGRGRCPVNPLMLVLALAGLLVSAQARLNAVILGRPVQAPVPGIVALGVVLALMALVLWLIRSAVRDGGFLRLRPRVVTT